MNTHWSSISLLALAAATSAAAQTASIPSTDQATTNVEAVVVTATRTPMAKIKVADSLTVITDRDIALKQAQTLPDVLADVPGLNVVQTGGPGGLTAVYIRGTNPNHVKVLVDGIDVSDPSSSNGVFDFGQFPTTDIAQVEILRGPQSGLYGSDAIGGVINVVTKRGEGPPHATIDLEGGSFDTFDQSGAVSGAAGPFHYVATISHLDVGATAVTPLEFLAPGETRNDDSYDNLTVSTKLGFDVTRNFDLGLVARHTTSHLNFTGDDDVDFGFPDPVQSKSYDRDDYLRGTAHLSLFDGRLEQTLGVAYSDIHSNDFTPGFGTSLFYADRVKIDWQGDIRLVAGETLVLGAEHQHDATSQPVSASTDIESGYAELESNLFKNFNNTASVRYDANNRFGDRVTYRVAPTYYVEATGTKLTASVGTGFKAPTLSDMFQNFPSFGFFGNPNLRPEKSIGYDVGFEQYLFDRRVQFGATWFYNHITDLITDNASFTSLANIGRAHTEGVESFVLVQPLTTLSVRLDYTYTEARDDILHEALIRRPYDKWTLDTRWQVTSRLSTDFSLLALSGWVDGNRDFSVPRLAAPGYVTANLAANYDLTRQLTLYGRITNLFDARYEDPYGFLRPGLGAIVGVKLRL